MKRKNVSQLQASFRLAGMSLSVVRHDYFRYTLEIWMFMEIFLLSKL